MDNLLIVGRDNSKIYDLIDKAEGRSTCRCMSTGMLMGACQNIYRKFKEAGVSPDGYRFDIDANGGETFNNTYKRMGSPKSTHVVVSFKEGKGFCYEDAYRGWCMSGIKTIGVSYPEGLDRETVPSFARWGYIGIRDLDVGDGRCNRYYDIFQRVEDKREELKLLGLSSGQIRSILNKNKPKKPKEPKVSLSDIDSIVEKQKEKQKTNEIGNEKSHTRGM